MRKNHFSCDPLGKEGWVSEDRRIFNGPTTVVSRTCSEKSRMADQRIGGAPLFDRFQGSGNLQGHDVSESV